MTLLVFILIAIMIFSKQKDIHYKKFNKIQISMIREVKCPKCCHIGTAMSVEYNDKRIVFDACKICGTKLTEWTEI